MSQTPLVRREHVIDGFKSLSPRAVSALRNGPTGLIARGLALRMDHGTQYLSDHFLNQVRFWGIQPSFGFVQEPETNGVAERFNRTLKEQAIYGRVFRNLEEVRTAVATFVATYNEHWMIQKLRHDFDTLNWPLLII